MLKITGMDSIDKKEFKTVIEYLEQNLEDLSKKKKDRTPDCSKKLLQMANTIRRALALAD